MDAGETHPLNDAEMGGVIAMTVFASASFTGVVLLLLHIFSITVAPVLCSGRPNNEEQVFLRMQLGVFVVCLLISDLMQSIAGLMQGHWAMIHAVQPGAICTMQAALLEFGDVATGIWNTIVAIHTFMGVVLGKRMSKPWVIGLVIFGWSMAIFLTILGPFILYKPEKGPFYGVSLQWCFVREPYGLYRILIHHFPLLLFSFIILVLYVMVFLTLRGSLVVDGFSFHWVRGSRPSESKERSHLNSHLRTLAKKVLWYPIMYITLVVPVSVCRLVSLDPRNPPVPQAAFMVAICLLLSMGCANSIIYAFTRRIGSNPLFSRSKRGSWFSGSKQINETSSTSTRPRTPREPIQVLVRHATTDDARQTPTPISDDVSDAKRRIYQMRGNNSSSSSVIDAGKILPSSNCANSGPKVKKPVTPNGSSGTPRILPTYPHPSPTFPVFLPSPQPQPTPVTWKTPSSPPKRVELPIQQLPVLDISAPPSASNSPPASWKNPPSPPKRAEPPVRQLPVPITVPPTQPHHLSMLSTMAVAGSPLPDLDNTAPQPQQLPVSSTMAEVGSIRPLPVLSNASSPPQYVSAVSTMTQAGSIRPAARPLPTPPQRQHLSLLSTAAEAGSIINIRERLDDVGRIGDNRGRVGDHRVGMGDRSGSQHHSPPVTYQRRGDNSRREEIDDAPWLPKCSSSSEEASSEEVRR